MNTRKKITSRDELVEHIEQEPDSIEARGLEYADFNKTMIKRAAKDKFHTFRDELRYVVEAYNFTKAINHPLGFNIASRPIWNRLMTKGEGDELPLWPRPSKTEYINNGSRKIPMVELSATTVEKAVKDIVTNMKFGKFLTRYFSDIMTETEIRYAAEKFEEMFGFIEPIIVMTPQEIGEVYAECEGTSCASCMTRLKDTMHPVVIDNGVLPVEAYGAGDIGVAYIKDSNDEISGRVLVWPERKWVLSKYYGAGDTIIRSLKKQGWTAVGSFEGARLLAIPLGNKGAYLGPYLDNCEKLRLDDDGYFYIDSEGDYRHEKRADNLPSSGWPTGRIVPYKWSHGKWRGYEEDGPQCMNCDAVGREMVTISDDYEVCQSCFETEFIEAINANGDLVYTHTDSTVTTIDGEVFTSATAAEVNGYSYVGDVGEYVRDDEIVTDVISGDYLWLNDASINTIDVVMSDRAGPTNINTLFDLNVARNLMIWEHNDHNLYHRDAIGTANTRSLYNAALDVVNESIVDVMTNVTVRTYDFIRPRIRSRLYEILGGDESDIDILDRAIYTVAASILYRLLTTRDNEVEEHLIERVA